MCLNPTYYELVLISFNALLNIAINILKKYKNSWIFPPSSWSGTRIVFSVSLEHVGSALHIHYSATLNILQYSALVDNTSFIR